MGPRKRGKRENSKKMYIMNMAENFSKLKKELDIQLQESQSPEQGETIMNHTKIYHN